MSLELFNFVDGFSKVENRLKDPLIAYTSCHTGVEKLLFQKIGLELEICDNNIRAEVEGGRKRIDLVIFDSNLKNKISVIEGKLQLTALTVIGYNKNNRDITWQARREQDFKKLRAIHEDLKKYFVAFILHYSTDYLPPPFKYNIRHNLTIKRINKLKDDNLYPKGAQSHEILKSETNNRWINYFNTKNLSYNQFDTQIGTHYDIPIELTTFIVKLV